MSSKRKIALGPLPEQREDYSHYEESFVRWDRIVGFGLLVLVVLLLLISLSTANKDDALDFDEAETPLDSSIKEPKIAVIEKTDDPDSVKQASPKPEVTVPPLGELKPEELAQLVSTPKVVEEPKEIKAPAPEAKPLETDSDESVNAQPAVKISEASPASVLIINSAIKEAVLSLSIKNDVPGEPLQHRVVMPESGLIKVILHTEMHGLRGATLYHHWYREGVRQAKVRIPVNVAKQKSYSSKFIDKHMLGAWQVKVLDASGELYILADFEVVSAN